MGVETNKHGLSRTIPSEIRAEIRKTDGYGCVKCGNIFIQYEHIDPLFCDAKKHDPKHITLLCSGCHGESTGKRLPKRLIYQLKENPCNKKRGFAKAEFYPNPEEMKIEVGNSTFSNTYIALTIHGKPLIWVSKDTLNEKSPLLYNAIFMDSQGNTIGYLNKNHFIGIVGGCDFQAILNRIEVRSKKGEINLILEIEGDEIVKVKRLFFNYLGCIVKIAADGFIQLVNSNTRIGHIHTDYCNGGLGVGSIPHKSSPFTKLSTSILFIKSKKISNIFGQHQGFLLEGKIFDLNYNLVGMVDDISVYNLVGEYIGNLLINESYIHVIMENDEYLNQEPIWISSRNRILFLFQPSIIIDMSHRLFIF